MDIQVFPGPLCGQIQAIPSKSQAHRLLICAAFSDRPTNLICSQTNRDIEATAACLNALGANITRTASGYYIEPIRCTANHAELPCGESGSTLRFMLPIVGALGVDATFLLEGRLPYRPLSPLWEEMERMGCQLSRPTESTIHCTGKLLSGTYRINGNISSQFITGLLFALPLIPGQSQLEIIGNVESKPYIDMTVDALRTFGVSFENHCIQCHYPFCSPGELTVEGDWSNGAFFLTAIALGHDITVNGLSAESLQGDRAVADLLPALECNITVDASDVPDLVPILSVAAGAKAGATFENIARLRLKESDRVASVAEMLHQLGVNTQVSDHALQVYAGTYHSCTVDSCSDHRIAMAAAIAATVADGPVLIRNAQCVEKSYPAFWDEFRKLGGHYEQYIR